MNLKKAKIEVIAASVFILSILAACSGNNKTKTTPPTAKIGPPIEKQNIVFINSDSLLAKYEYFKDIKTKMEKKSKAAESELAGKEQAFKREVQQYQQQANSLSADQRTATEQRLARKQQELQTYSQNAGAALQNEQAKEQAALYDKVADYLKEYAKSKGYKLILTYQKGNSAILFGDQSLDVTKEVLEGLNKAYKRE